MSTPTYCTSCGHELGVGRFCTNCGRPVPGRHPEAAPAPSAPPAPATVVPPPVGELPPSPRYPLFAEAPPTAPVPPAAAVPAPPYHPASPQVVPPPRRGRGGGWLPWVVALVLLAVVAGVGGYLVVGSGDGDRDADDPSSSPTEVQPPEPDSSGTGGPVEAPDPTDVVDLTSGISAEVPAVATPSRDRDNRPVRYVAANMWDGKPRTTWRMPGDGTGQAVTFDLGREVVLTEVGLINGYAKVDGPDNWYLANRRIGAVQWELDDGTRITQELDELRRLQSIEIDPVATRTVTLHLLEVTPPAPGATGRDFTAISEVRFRGTAD